MSSNQGDVHYPGGTYALLLRVRNACEGYFIDLPFTKGHSQVQLVKPLKNGGQASRVYCRCSSMALYTLADTANRHKCCICLKQDESYVPSECKALK